MRKQAHFENQERFTIFFLWIIPKQNITKEFFHLLDKHLSKHHLIIS